jgi:hypothetical protein
MEPLIVKAFKDFAKAAHFYDDPYDKQTMLQLIAAIGFAETAGGDIPLMLDLLEAIGIPLESVDTDDCLVGNVY